jgi:hypothetical protein
MLAFLSDRQPFSQSLAGLVLLVLGTGLAGCASVGDTVSSAFADPAKYDLYDCKQLQAERKALAGRASDLQALITKAETGVGGAVVVEMAYRNDVIAVQGQRKLVEEGWRRNKCQESKLEVPAVVAPAEPSAPAPIGGGPRLPGSPVY